jgi:hypothetical protein
VYFLCTISYHFCLKFTSVSCSICKCSRSLFSYFSFSSCNLLSYCSREFRYSSFHLLLVDVFFVPLLFLVITFLVVQETSVVLLSSCRSFFCSSKSFFFLACRRFSYYVTSFSFHPHDASLVLVLLRIVSCSSFFWINS